MYSVLILQSQFFALLQFTFFLFIYYVRRLSLQMQQLRTEFKSAKARGSVGSGGGISNGYGYGNNFNLLLQHHVTYSQYEILKHQNQELELQNRRLVERISKLKYILKGKKRRGICTILESIDAARMIRVC